MLVASAASVVRAVARDGGSGDGSGLHPVQGGNAKGKRKILDELRRGRRCYQGPDKQQAGCYSSHGGTQQWSMNHPTAAAAITNRPVAIGAHTTRSRA